MQICGKIFQQVCYEYTWITTLTVNINIHSSSLLSIAEKKFKSTFISMHLMHFFNFTIRINEIYWNILLNFKKYIFIEFMPFWHPFLNQNYINMTTLQIFFIGINKFFYYSYRQSELNISTNLQVLKRNL